MIHVDQNGPKRASDTATTIMLIARKEGLVKIRLPFNEHEQHIIK